MSKLLSIVTLAATTIATLAIATSIAVAAPAEAKKDSTVRFFPDNDSDAVTQLSAGDLVEVLDCDDGWCRIDFAGFSGFVKKNRLDFDVQPPVEEAKACFFEHINFEGNFFCEPLGTSESIIDIGWNDMISSVQLFGGAKVRVCEHINFDGACSTWVSTKSSVGMSWNDRVSSYEVF